SGIPETTPSSAPAATPAATPTTAPTATPAPAPSATPEPTPTPGGVSETTLETLQKILTGTNGLLTDQTKLPMSFEDAVSADISQGMLGLTASEFGQYVTEAYTSTAAFGSIAHEVALIRCKDAAAAVEVKKLVASGFNSLKWICVFPRQSFVVESGSYVLLGAVTNEAAAALQSSFSSALGGSGTPNVFYTALE
ncbi:MAG: DUF4358 domain-containing protein, partial [Oscillospiraceae bacterium]|nr:DUF4358 domain-containing protein [Oscillospiraceae bacterium]